MLAQLYLSFKEHLAEAILDSLWIKMEIDEMNIYTYKYLLVMFG